jgi:hypothetical protein
MLDHRDTAHALTIAAASLLACACSAMSPGHVGRYTFQGKVTNEAGAPVPNAWVKVRGWETLTDAQGKWQQVQVVDCGTLREHMDSFEENDAVLVAAEGYQSNEEKFVVKHPGWFQSCTPEQVVILDTVLKPESPAVKANRAESKNINPPKESPNLPFPGGEEHKATRKGGYTL